MIERRDETNVLAAQHTVAEDVTTHVSDPHRGEVVVLGIDAEFPEVPLDTLPGALRRDTHGFVVVADRSAGCEGVAEPKSVLRGNVVRDVGKLCSALVRGDNKISVVPVVANDPSRRDNGAALFVDVVGQIE
jgi:hypothetical protein